MSKLGLLAAGGEVPVLVARGAKGQGIEVIGIAVTDVHPDFEEAVSRIYRIGLDRISDALHVLASEGIKDVVVAGKVQKYLIFADPGVAKGLSPFLAETENRNDAPIFMTFLRKLEGLGITVKDQTTYLGPSLAREGRITRRAPTPAEMDDVRFGFKIAKYVADADIGQTVVVRNRAVLAIEAIEGTDCAIIRGGILGCGGAVVVKVSKTHQDMRFDVPTVGTDTIDSMMRGGCSALGVEAGRTIVIAEKEVASMADEAGIAVMAIRGDAV